MCNCNKTNGAPAQSYVVRRANGSEQTFDSKVEADIEVSKSGGTVTVKRK